MSILFSPGNIGTLEIKNRLVRAPVYEALAGVDSTIGEEMIRFHSRLAQGGAGLICTGYMFVDPVGRAQKFQAGIHSDEMLPGLSRLADTIHNEDAKVAFELSHAGQQTLKSITGHHPVGPSRFRRDPSYLVKAQEMTEDQILDTIDAFVSAAARAVKAGSDIIYLHAGGGDLLNQFLSPFFNVRNDQWGGSDENRFRILRNIITGIKQSVPSQIPILVKLNSRDLSPGKGITSDLAAKYVGWLNDCGVSGLELTTGIKFYNHMNCWRGDVPVNEIVRALPYWKKPVGWLMMKQLQNKHNLIEGWGLPDLKHVKSNAGTMALFLVGGMRNKSHMETVIKNSDADFISLARPLIREPSFVNRLKDEKTDTSSCKSCNRCIAGVMNHLPTACYYKGLP